MPSGVSHASALPSVREPGRNRTGTNSSASFASRGPAKRTSRPPFFEPALQRGAIGRRDAARVGQDQRLRARIDQLADAAALQARIRLQRALGVEQFRKQRLARAAGIDQAHERPPRARRQQAAPRRRSASPTIRTRAARAAISGGNSMRADGG